jgi:probable O-glycosylation ligase (exosortase A-associated)
MKGLLFTYALTYGGAVVSLFNPYYGLLIYVCFAIIKPPALWHWSVPAGHYSRIIGVAFLLGWAIHGFGDQRLGRAKPIVLALLGYWLWVTLSTLLSPQPDRGLPFVEYLAKIVLPFVAGVTLIQTWTQLKQLLWVILGSSAFLAFEVNLAYLQGFSFATGKFLGVDNNTFSILMDTSFGLALVLAFEEPVAWRRYMCFGIAAAMAHVPMLAMSRGGMVGALVAAGIALVVIPKTARTWLMILAVICVGSILAGPSVIDEFSTTLSEAEERDFSAQSRLDLWRDCTDAMMRNPLFGVGTECWQLVTESYGWPEKKEAHSLWFQTAAELGVPGVTFLFLFYFLTISMTWQAARRTDAPWMPTLARMMLVSLTGFAVSAAFVTVEGFELPFYVALLGACGLKIAYATVPTTDETWLAEHALLETDDTFAVTTDRRWLVS